jgi:hypothetical protein
MTIQEFEVEEGCSWTNVSNACPDWIVNYTVFAPGTAVTSVHGHTLNLLTGFSRLLYENRKYYLVEEIRDRDRMRSAWACLGPAPYSTGRVDAEKPEVSASQRPQIADWVEEIVSWLGCSYDDLALITGVSRNSFFNWRHYGRQPRAEATRSVTRVHSLVSALVNRLGVDGARSWLASGEPTGWDALLQGKVSEVESRLRLTFMSDTSLIEKYARTVGGEEVTIEVRAEPQQLRRATRTSKKGPRPQP